MGRSVELLSYGKKQKEAAPPKEKKKPKFNLNEHCDPNLKIAVGAQVRRCEPSERTNTSVKWTDARLKWTDANLKCTTACRTRRVRAPPRVSASGWGC